MASDERRVFVFGGRSSPDAQVDDTKLIHVLDTSMYFPFCHFIWTAPKFVNIEHLDFLEPDSNAVNPSEETTQLARKSSGEPPTGGQPHQPSYSLSNAYAARGASPFQKATPKEMDHPASQQTTCEQNPSLNGLPSRPTGASGRLRPVPVRLSEEDIDGGGSTEHLAKPVIHPKAFPVEENALLEHGRLVELELQLSEMLVAQTERDRRIAQLTDELTLKSALLNQGAEERKRAGLELRQLQVKHDELLLSRDQAEANLAEEKKCTGLELRELQAKLDESLLSRNRALEQSQSALQNAAEANEQSQRELAEVHAKLEASESELAAFHLRPSDTENNCDKSKAEADTNRNQNATSLVNTDEGRVVHRLMERMQVMEAEIASLRWNEKNFETMECRNEG